MRRPSLFRDFLDFIVSSDRVPFVPDIIGSTHRISPPHAPDRAPMICARMSQLTENGAWHHFQRWAGVYQK